ncbi:MAG TPA: hypothetical protein PKV67_15860 [Hyphomonas sp.]|nr:hypothetical protein [Hyphomonas sp.]HRK66445.1 hypothetical protein [Hyphomonas sp.]
MSNQKHNQDNAGVNHLSVMLNDMIPSRFDQKERRAWRRRRLQRGKRIVTREAS